VIRLVCTDVDGTLVGKSGVVPPAVWRAAELAREASIRIAICSGRPAFGSALEYAKRLDADGWHVFQNGSSVLHLGTGRSLSKAVPAETVADLVARARATGRILELFTDTDYVVESDADRAQRHAALLGVPFVKRSLDSIRGAVVRAQWLVPRDDVAAPEREKRDGLEVVGSPSPIMPDTLFVNMTAAGVSKGSAVRAIAKEYGFQLGDVMMIGDALNDVGAMRIVGMAVAMRNSEPGVRESAQVEVDHVEDGGAAQAFDMARTGTFPPR
jgi:Cof subfamily protein (haloacid dehalogenase superfamily)